LRPLLEKENLWDLLGHIRKTLLSDYFEGLKLQELWLTH
jgi:tetratricopeptide (TPR) repeat protein